MALRNIVTIWSSQLKVKLRAAIVFAGPQVTNRNYQGEITARGDTVKVTGIVDPTIFDVNRNSDIPAPETLTDEEAELVIDQDKGFNFQVDDLDQLQHAVGGLVLQSAANAARKLAEAADSSIQAKMVAEAASDNNVGTTGSPISVEAPEAGVALTSGATTVYRLLLRLGVKLDKQGVPAEGRFVVLPPFMMAALAADPRFTAASVTGESVLRNGFQGSCAGFAVYKTSAVTPTSGKYKVVAGHPMATSYAEQIVGVEFYRPEARFAQAAKGRHVYGHKVFYPEALAIATVTDATGLD